MLEMVFIKEKNSMLLAIVHVYIFQHFSCIGGGWNGWMAVSKSGWRFGITAASIETPLEKCDQACSFNFHSHPPTCHCLENVKFMEGNSGLLSVWFVPNNGKLSPVY